MESNFKRIKHTKDKMKDDQSLCILCLERRENIVILGCNHEDIRDICEKQLD